MNRGWMDGWMDARTDGRVLEWRKGHTMRIVQRPGQAVRMERGSRGKRDI